MPKLIKIAQEYAYLKGIEVKPVMIAIRQLIDICGDKNIEDYDRADARNFIDKYENVKTTTIRRRLNSINAFIELSLLRMVVVLTFSYLSMKLRASALS